MFFKLKVIDLKFIQWVEISVSNLLWISDSILSDDKNVKLQMNNNFML